MAEPAVIEEDVRANGDRQTMAEPAVIEDVRANGDRQTMAEPAVIEEDVRANGDRQTMAESALVNAMGKRFKDLPESKPYTISRVPAYIRQTNKKMYEPMVIAIGPYHHRTEHLQTAEEHKCRYLRSLLDRPTTTASLGVLFEKMRALEQKARRHYSESIDFESDKFVEMMLLDGCFIIEFFLNNHYKDRTCNNMGWGLQFVEMDLLLFENQIPFLIIEELYGLIAGNAVGSLPSLMKLVRPICQMNSSLKIVRPTLPPPPEIHHLLHLYYHWAVPVMEISTSDHHSPPLGSSDHHSPPHGLPPEKSSSATSSENIESSSATSSEQFEIHCDQAIPSATALCEAGVRFRKKSSPRDMLDIKFQNGIMEIPFIQIDDNMKPTLTNLIAFEQSVLDSRRSITNFSVLMDSLINTENDVAILERCNIIENLLGSDEEVALFFNQLCEYVEQSDDPCFNDLFGQVNCYRESRWHRNRARLVHDYFSNPWSFMSLLAALLLLFLALVQAFFATFAYFRPPKSPQ